MGYTCSLHLREKIETYIGLSNDNTVQVKDVSSLEYCDLCLQRGYNVAAVFLVSYIPKEKLS